MERQHDLLGVLGQRTGIDGSGADLCEETRGHDPDGESGASPLRFGVARMAVFSPTGTASSGTVAFLGPSGVQFVVRVAGVTGRTRVLQFDRGRRLWAE